MASARRAAEVKLGSRSSSSIDVVADDRGGDFALDQRAVDDGADGGMVLGHVGAAAAARAGAETADGQRPLGHGIDAVVRAQQRRLQQHAALQRFGVAHGGDLHIEPRARLDKGRDVRGDQHDATFFEERVVAGTLMPYRWSMLARVCLRVDRVFVAVARQAQPPGRSRRVDCPARRQS